MIINLHGFKSHGKNSKYKILVKFFEEESIFSPTLPDSPFEVVSLVDDFLQNNRNQSHIIIGSSLGGFYANYFCKKENIPTHLINPSFKPWLNLSKQVGWHQRYGTKDHFEWRSAYLDELLELDLIIESLEHTDVELNLYLGKNDMVIDHNYLKEDFNRYRQVWTNDGHRFSEASFIKYVIPNIHKHFL